MEENICVAIRIRPLTEDERKSGQMAVWRTEYNTIISRVHEYNDDSKNNTQQPTPKMATPQKYNNNNNNNNTNNNLSTPKTSKTKVGGATISTPVKGSKATIARPTSSPSLKNTPSRTTTSTPTSTTKSSSSTSLRSTTTPKLTSTTSRGGGGGGGSAAKPTSSTSKLTSTPKHTSTHTVKKDSSKSDLPSSPTMGVPELPYSSAKMRVYSYTFDHLFRPSETTQEIYERMAEQLVWSAMDGYNATIFAYGQTGSGKTYTMKGNLRRSPGIIPLSLQDVFAYIDQTPEREFLLRVSYFEIYNEVINDLLSPSNTNLSIRESKANGIYLEGLKEEIVLSPEQAMSLLAAGEAHRHVGTTDYNRSSSRSHTIFRIVIESKQRQKSDVELDEFGLIIPQRPAAVKVSFLNLIDLAGSEKAWSHSEKSGLAELRRKEGAYINKSLLTLGNVISKLSGDKNQLLQTSNNSSKGGVHIPYRDSKLTRILESSLRGNAKIAIICAISVATSSFEETHNTLKFANRAKAIKNAAKVNEFVDDKSLIKQYRNEIDELKRKLQMVKEQEAKLHKLDELLSEKERLQKYNTEMEEKLRYQEEEKSQLEEKINRLSKLILVSNNIPSSSSPSSPNPSSNHHELRTPPSPSSYHHKLTSLMKRKSKKLSNSPISSIIEGDDEDEDDIHLSTHPHHHNHHNRNMNGDGDDDDDFLSQEDDHQFNNVHHHNHMRNGGASLDDLQDDDLLGLYDHPTLHLPSHHIHHHRDGKNHNNQSPHHHHHATTNNNHHNHNIDDLLRTIEELRKDNNAKNAQILQLKREGEEREEEMKKILEANLEQLQVSDQISLLRKLLQSQYQRKIKELEAKLVDKELEMELQKSDIIVTSQLSKKAE